MRQFYQDVVNGQNLDALGELLTPDGVDLFRMEDGKQAEHWGGPDMFSFLMQLGVIPGPGTPA